MGELEKAPVVLAYYRVLEEPLLWAVMFESQGAITVQGLGYDIGAFGKDEETAKRRMAGTVEAEKAYSFEKTGEYFGGIDPAPKKFFDMAAQCTGEHS